MTKESHSHDPPGRPAMKAAETSNAQPNHLPAQLPIALGNASAGQAQANDLSETAGVTTSAVAALEDTEMMVQEVQALGEKEMLQEQTAALQSAFRGFLAERGVTVEQAARLGFHMVSKEEMAHQEQQQAMTATLEGVQSQHDKLERHLEQIREYELKLAKLKGETGEIRQILAQRKQQAAEVIAQADANSVPTASEQARKWLAAEKAAEQAAEIERLKKGLLRRRQQQGTKMQYVQATSLGSGQQQKQARSAAPTADSSAGEQNSHEAEVAQVTTNLAKLSTVVQSSPADHCPDSTGAGQPGGQLQIKVMPVSQGQTVLALDQKSDNCLLVAQQRAPNSVEHVQILDRSSAEVDSQMQPAKWRSHLRCEPEWQEQAQDSSLVMASLNVNGLPQEGEVVVDELVNIMDRFGVDILALQETKLSAEDAERLGRSLARHQLTAKFSCAPESEGAQQNGVAVLLSPQIRNHLVGFNEVVVGPAQAEGTGMVPKQALGTSIRLRLAFRRRQELHVIVVYMPHKATNPEAWVRTQTIVAVWIRYAQSKGYGLLVLGDFNEQINKGSNLTEVGQLLYNSCWLQEAHHSLYGQEGGDALPQCEGAQQSQIDFLFASMHMGLGFRQSTVVQDQTKLGEDRHLIVAEWVVNLRRKGAERSAQAICPRLNTLGASEDVCWRFREELADLEFDPGKMDKQVGELAVTHFNNKQAWKLQAQMRYQRAQAGKIRQVLEHRMGKGESKRAQWLAAVEEFHQLLTDGLPQGVRDHCQQLMATDTGEPGWQKQQKVLTNLLGKRLRKHRKQNTIQHSVATRNNSNF
ncbi:hypothetical protein GGH17_001239 [Coemansia sp. RSA 788]|nr:hypothetical protein GGH17_001239 [Coemansia sp. RSA 788]